MSSDPIQDKPSPSEGAIASDSLGPVDRRSRPRREPKELDQELAPVLSNADPEIRKEFQKLVKEGQSGEAEKRMMDYVLSKNPSAWARSILQKKSRKDKRALEKYTYLVSLIPVAIALYCIFSLLFTGHIEFPHFP